MRILTVALETYIYFQKSGYFLFFSICSNIDDLGLITL